MAGIKHTPMKVLMTTDTVGGVWSYSMELCRMLTQVQFHLATAGAKLNEGQKKEVENLHNVIVYESQYKLEWMENVWNDIDKSGEWLLELEEIIRPDLVHLNSYSYGVLPFNAPKIIVAHSDVFSWWQDVKGEMPPGEWNEYYNRVKQGIEAVDLVIAPSRAMKKCIQEIYAVTSLVKVIYNGRSKEMFNSRNKKSCIFSMGRVWDEAKNINLLIKASEKLDFNIRIAGDQQFERNSFEHSSDKIKFLGRLNNDSIAAELSEACLYVLPAKYEPFGLSALEAAMSACALVLGDIPSLREIWQDAALYVDVNDEGMLAKRINGLMGDSEQLKHYQYKALERAENFSSAAMASAYLEIYRWLVRHSNANLKQHISL
jgi:glycosyltransferase involved in cell wall biosynthesis